MQINPAHADTPQATYVVIRVPLLVNTCTRAPVITLAAATTRSSYPDSSSGLVGLVVDVVKTHEGRTVVIPFKVVLETSMEVLFFYNYSILELDIGGKRVRVRGGGGGGVNM